MLNSLQRLTGFRIFDFHFSIAQWSVAGQSLGSSRPAEEKEKEEEEEKCLMKSSKENVLGRKC